MAVTLEQVERLRERAEISYGQARALLEETGGDVLEALIRLERQGGVKGSGEGAYYSTRPAGAEGPDGGMPPPYQEPGQGTAPSPVAGGGKQKGPPRFWAKMKELLLAGLNLLRHSTINQLEVWRNGELMTSIPLLILVILIIVAFWVSVPLLLFGLVFGCQYRIAGPDLNQEKINQVISTVSATVNGAAERVKEGFQKAAEKEK